MNKRTPPTRPKLNHFFFFCGHCMLASELWKQWYLTFRLNNGSFQWWYFPFQMCSIAMYILLLLPWVSRPRLRHALLAFLMCYSLLGGIAVFADTSGLQYPVIPLTVHSYLWHLALIQVGLAAGLAYLHELSQLPKPASLRPFIDSTLLYFGCCIMATLINHIGNKYGLINMFYINPKYKMQQIGFSALSKLFGNTIAIYSYVVGTVLGAWILYCLWSAADKWLNKKKKI